MPCSGNVAQRLPELHRGMVLYLGSLVPNSVVTEEKPHCMLTHRCLLSLLYKHKLKDRRQTHVLQQVFSWIKLFVFV